MEQIMASTATKPRKKSAKSKAKAQPGVAEAAAATVAATAPVAATGTSNADLVARRDAAVARGPFSSIFNNSRSNLLKCCF